MDTYFYPLLKTNHSALFIGNFTFFKVFLVQKCSESVAGFFCFSHKDLNKKSIKWDLIFINLDFFFLLGRANGSYVSFYPVSFAWEAKGLLRIQENRLCSAVIRVQRLTGSLSSLWGEF